MTRFALVALLVAAPLAAADDAPLTKIAFGSCADQDKPCPIWDSLAAQKPELMILLGDTIYADLDKSKKVTPELIQSKYDKLNALPGFAKLRETTKLIGTYDDHDYGKNDGDATWPLKDDAQKLLLDFYKVAPDSPRRTRKGAYHAEIYGPPGKRVQVILTDGRYFRSPLKQGPRRLIPGYGNPIAPYIPDPAGTVLGDDQWKWLEEQLKQPAELRLLGSGVQVLSEDHPFEKWMNYPAERDRLYKLLRDTKAAGVVILSGDRHLAEMSLDTKAIGYPLYDLTSSGFNQASKSWRAPEPNRHRVAAMPYGDNFGLVTVDWSSETSPRVSLQLRDEDGEIVARQNIRLGLLTPTPGAKEPAPATPDVPRPDGVIDAAAALTKVGETVTVQFAVKGGRLVPKRLLLNSDADFRSDANFTVVLTGKALAEGKYKDATFDTFKGKTVRVTGKVTEFQKRPQLQVEDETKIEVVEK